LRPARPATEPALGAEFPLRLRISQPAEQIGRIEK